MNKFIGLVERFEEILDAARDNFDPQSNHDDLRGLVHDFKEWKSEFLNTGACGMTQLEAMENLKRDYPNHSVSATLMSHSNPLYSADEWQNFYVQLSGTGLGAHSWDGWWEALKTLAQTIGNRMEIVIGD